MTDSGLELSACDLNHKERAAAAFRGHTKPCGPRHRGTGKPAEQQWARSQAGPGTAILLLKAAPFIHCLPEKKLCRVLDPARPPVPTSHLHSPGGKGLDASAFGALLYRRGICRLRAEGEPTACTEGQDFQVPALPEDFLSRVPNAPEEDAMNRATTKGDLIRDHRVEEFSFPHRTLSLETEPSPTLLPSSISTRAPLSFVF